MPRDPEPTRRRLLDAAEDLFARRGLDVPLQEITRAAGQRNSGAVHYHFGGRDGLLRAIVQRHVPGVTARRGELLAEARKTPDDPAGYARAIVLPITDQLYGSPQDRAYLQISVALLRDPASPATRLMGGHDVAEVADAVVAALPGVPPDDLRERVFLTTQMIGMLCASRAARTSDAGAAAAAPPGVRRSAALTREELERHLVAVCAAAFVTDPSAPSGT